MEDLEAQVDSNDFAVFVFSPDDLVIMRGKTYLQPRDNTIFEMGLFWGKLRRRRVFYIIPNTVTREVGEFTVEDFHIPSDLAGLTVLTYEIRGDGNYTAAVNVSCHAIKTAIAKEGLFIDPNFNLLRNNGKLNRRTCFWNSLLNLLIVICWKIDMISCTTPYATPTT